MVVVVHPRLSAVQFPGLAHVSVHVGADRAGALQRSSGSGSAAVQVLLSAARVASEFVYAPACLSFNMVLVMTGGGDQLSCLLVVVAAGTVGTTTSRRVHRWALGTVGQRAGAGSVVGRAILR